MATSMQASIPEAKVRRQIRIMWRRRWRSVAAVVCALALASTTHAQRASALAMEFGETDESVTVHDHAAYPGKGVAESAKSRGTQLITELWYCLAVWVKDRFKNCVEAQALSEHAIALALYMFPEDYWLRDAFRHCTWCAWMAIFVGDQDARMIATNHESGHNPIEEEMMDHYNNAIGLTIGRNIRQESSADTTRLDLQVNSAVECYLKALDGFLKTLD